ncbi:unnamed protein product [Peniophora sp. CBMAI 1063]|nr:unnamed protein product [Peniophora sp. CBMAI 1063]
MLRRSCSVAVVHSARHRYGISVRRRRLVTQAQVEYAPRESEPDVSPSRSPLATPRELVKYLDEYVVGQEYAKKTLSVAVYNHYNRVRANIEALEAQHELEWEQAQDNAEATVIPAKIRPHPRRLPLPTLPHHPFMPAPLVEKSNVLVIGPTGSGKTLLVRTLARVLDVPFSVSDATSFTQAGYVGEDVDTCIHRLLQAANNDPSRASTGIVYIDEVDKIARRSSGGMEGSRDVGGEGVQQALLRMMEGSVVNVPSKPLGGDLTASEGRSKPGRAPKPETHQIDTSNILFILSGAFEGLPKIINSRMAKGSIGFTANLKPDTNDKHNDFMPFFTPNRGVAPNVLESVQPTDLVKFGFIPEFISRLPTITTLSPLTPHDLRRILTDVRGSLVSQYCALFNYSGVEIKFTSSALDEICKKAAERGGGARGLRGIMESLLLDAMYETPGSDIRFVLIDGSVVRGEQPAMYWTEREGGAFWARWQAEEAEE